jgi:tetratricopeptide (TPR) repeat protein
MAFVVAVVGWKDLRQKTTSRGSVFLGLLAVGSLLFVMLIDPSLTMQRDWDLFALCGFAPMLLLLQLLPDKPCAMIRRLVFSVLVISVAFLFPFLLVNVDEQRSVAEAKQIVDNTPEKSLGTIAYLSSYFQTIGDQHTMDSLEARKRVLYPDFYRMRNAFDLLLTQHVPEASQEFRQVTPDKFWKDYHQWLATYYTIQANYDSAMYHANAMIQLQQYFDGGYTTLAAIYSEQRQPEKALIALRRGLALNNRATALLLGLADSFDQLGAYDSALVYGKRAVAIDPRSAQAYYYLAWACLGLHRNDEALEYFQGFMRVGPGSPWFERYLGLLVQASPELKEALNRYQDSTATHTGTKEP